MGNTCRILRWLEHFLRLFHCTSANIYVWWRRCNISNVFYAYHCQHKLALDLRLSWCIFFLSCQKMHNMGYLLYCIILQTSRNVSVSEFFLNGSTGRCNDCNLLQRLLILPVLAWIFMYIIASNCNRCSGGVASSVSEREIVEPGSNLDRFR